jgi:hypothetical protein
MKQLIRAQRQRLLLWITLIQPSKSWVEIDRVESSEERVSNNRGQQAIKQSRTYTPVLVAGH